MPWTAGEDQQSADPELTNEDALRSQVALLTHLSEHQEGAKVSGMLPHQTREVGECLDIALISRWTQQPDMSFRQPACHHLQAGFCRFQVNARAPDMHGEASHTGDHPFRRRSSTVSRTRSTIQEDGASAAVAVSGPARVMHQVALGPSGLSLHGQHAVDH